MKLSEVYSTSPRPVGSLATRAALVALVVTALLGGLMGQTAWAQATSTQDFTETPTAASSPTATETPSLSSMPAATETAIPTLEPSATSAPSYTPSTLVTIPAGRNLTPIAGTVTPILPTTGAEEIDPAECESGYTVQMGKIGRDIIIYFDCLDDERAVKAD